jgi:serpin B
MTYAGAEGATEKEMAGVLRFTLPEAQVHPAFSSLMATLNAPKKDTYELRIANRLWGQKGYGFLPEYLATTRKQYGAELAQVDFVKNPEESRQEINTWVERQTNGKITDLLPSNSITDLTTLVLTNAIYFKGKWRYEFNKKVPYKGDDLSMLILLPKKVDGLPRLEKDLSSDNLDKWSSAMLREEVLTYLPRFKLTEQFQLNSLLAEMGMPSAFDPGKADFSGMNGKRDLFISAAVHKAFVDVNEEGTEAAAATGVAVAKSIAAEPKILRADHPFVFMIRENRTGSILFMGRVVNPKG